MPQREHVLSGYKVLDFTQYIAGPTVTRMMAEMGAEVIKVEMAPGATMSARCPTSRTTAAATSSNRTWARKAFRVDVRSAAGLAIIKELIPRVDVVVENFGPGTMVRLGLGYDVVKEINPKAVMCSISTFGQNGPLATKPGWDFIGACYAGVIDMIGEKDGLRSLRALPSETPAPVFTASPLSWVHCSIANAAVSGSFWISACLMHTSPIMILAYMLIA